MSRTQQVSPPASIDIDDTKSKNEKNKSKRPPNTAFRQQRLKAWQPILTPKTVLPLFFVVGIIFAPIGGLLLYASTQVQEIMIDYTQCSELSPTNTPAPIPVDRISSTFTSLVNKDLNVSHATWMHAPANFVTGTNGMQVAPYDTSECTITFNLPATFKPPVFLYYRLTKFYQNHRRYVQSYDQDQLKGQFRTASQIHKSNCEPLKNNGSNLPYYPCGLIANSLFNDTFFSPVLLDAPGSSGNNVTYEMVVNGTAWTSDRDLYKPTKYKNNNVAPPPNWMKMFPSGYNDTYPIPQLQSWQQFQVWMRTAALPTFTKLALRNDSAALTSGTYQIKVFDEFPAHLYGGTKQIYISTRTVIGGKNPNLGIAYVVVGGLCVLLGAIFTVTHLIKPRKLGDHSYLSWNDDNNPTATATGRSMGPNGGA